jgi:hypothetical protein
MIDKKELNEIIEMLNQFVSGVNRSKKFAEKIEVKLDSLFPDEEEIQEYVTYFASYRPGGGELLYDEMAMNNKSKSLISILSSMA